MKRLPTKLQNICGVYVRRARNDYARRHRCKMTQLNLAIKLQLKGIPGFDRSTVSKIETGIRQVSDVELKYLAAALEVSTEYLLYGMMERLPSFDELESLVAEDDAPEK